MAVGGNPEVFPYTYSWAAGDDNVFRPARDYEQEADKKKDAQKSNHVDGTKAPSPTMKSRKNQKNVQSSPSGGKHAKTEHSARLVSRNRVCFYAYGWVEPLRMISMKL